MIINQQVKALGSSAKVASGTWRSNTLGSSSSTFTITDLSFMPKVVWIYSQNMGSYVTVVMADIENEVGYFYKNTGRNDAIFGSNSGTTNYRINVYDDNRIVFTCSSGFTYSAGIYTWYAIG